jgi:glycosyltransferase involved in cell wall biosynthesis
MIDLSVVIPSYNNLRLLKNSLNSVLSQRNIVIEIIIVDDSTTDEIEYYIRTLKDDRILYYKNTPIKGAIKNWNFGLELANGNYITILHHDEYYADPINQLSSIFSHNKNYDILISKIHISSLDNSVYVSLLYNFMKNFVINHIPSFLFFYNFIGPVSCVVFKNDKKYFFNINMKWLVDVEWYYRLLSNNKNKYFNQFKIYSILAHDNKITNNINVEIEYDKDLLVLQEKYKSLSAVIFFTKLKRLIYFIN